MRLRAEAGCTVLPEKIWRDCLLLHTPTFLHPGPGLTSAPWAHTSFSTCPVTSLLPQIILGATAQPNLS